MLERGASFAISKWYSTVAKLVTYYRGKKLVVINFVNFYRYAELLNLHWTSGVSNIGTIFLVI